MKNIKYVKYFRIEFNQIFIVENVKHEDQSLVQLLKNNQTVNLLIKNVYIHERSKYIDVFYHHIRDLYNKNLIKLNYISNADMIADDLTKLLLKNKFKIFVKQLRLQKSKVSENQLHWLMNQLSSLLNESIEKNDEISRSTEFIEHVKFIEYSSTKLDEN